MAERADGAIYINTSIETDGFVAGGKEIEAACRRMAKQVNGIGESAKIALQKQTDAFVKQNQTIARQEEKVSELKSKYEELSNQKIETKEFEELTKEIDSLLSKWSELDNEWTKLSKEGFPFAPGKGAMKELEDEMDKLDEKISSLKRKKTEMIESGNAYVTPDTSGTEKKLFYESQKLDQMHNQLGTSYASLKEKVRQYTQESDKSVSTQQKVLSVLKKIGLIAASTAKSGFGKVTSAIKKMIIAMASADKSANKTSMSMGHMLAMSLMFSTVFRALSLVTGGIGEGINNLSKYSKETNASMSMLMSALTRLKNSFATAFSPILTVVAPILTSFINMLSKAITYVGMFIASLTGKGYFTKAVDVQEDYAASLDKTSKNSKKANKAAKSYLTSLDEINKVEKDSTSNAGNTGTPGKASPSEMFNVVEIPSSIANIAKKIKDLIKNQDWEGLGEYLAEGINKGLQKVYDAINWDNVGPRITYFVNAFTTTFNSLVDNINWDLLGRTIGAGINTIVNTLNLLIEGIDWTNLGRKFSEGINGAFREINWTNLGNLLGNYFMISWRILYGLVNGLDYSLIGTSVGNGINGAFAKIDFNLIGKTLATGFNGAVTALNTAIKTVKWPDMATNFVNGLNSIVSGVDWVNLANTINLGITTALDTLGTAITTFDWSQLGTNLATFLKTVDWIGIIINAIGVAGDMITSLTSLGTSFMDSLADGIKDGAANFISKGLDALVDFTANLRENAGKLVDSGLNLMEELAKGIANSIPSIIKNVPKIVSNIANTINDNGPKILVAGVKIIATLILGLIKAIPDLVAAIPSIIKAIVDVFTAYQWLNLGLKIITWFKDGIVAAKDSVVSAAGNIKDKIIEAVKVLPEKLKEIGGNGISYMKTAISNGLSSLKSKAGEILTTIVDALKDLPGKMKGKISTGLGNMKTAITNGLSAIKNKAGEIVTKIMDALKDLPSKMKEKATSAIKGMWKRFTDVNWGSLGKNIIKGIIQGIKDAAGSLMSSLANLAKDALNVAKKTLGIHSPSRVFRDVIGKMIPAGVTLGIERGFPDTFRTLQSLSDKLTGIKIPMPTIASGTVMPPRASVVNNYNKTIENNSSNDNQELLMRLLQKLDNLQSQGGTYNFTAQINRRTIFDEVIEEAKIRRDASGFNPFELAY